MAHNGQQRQLRSLEIGVASVISPQPPRLTVASGERKVTHVWKTHTGLITRLAGDQEIGNRRCEFG